MTKKDTGRCPAHANEKKVDPSRRRFLKTSGLAALGATVTLPKFTVARTPELTANPKPHFAVIGAGAFGGWTALHLLRSGAQVTLLDAWGPGNSRASSGGETRVIRGIYGPDRIYVELVTRSFELWRENEQRWNAELYLKTGTLWMFSVEDTYAQQSLPLQKEFGLRVDQLSLADARSRYPQIDFDSIQSVYYEHEAGYLKARHSCQVVRDAFVREGGSFKRVSVKPGKIRGGEIRRLRLSDGSTISADQYVFACGPWLGQVFPEAIGNRIQPSRQEAYYFGTPAGDSQFSEGNLPIWVEFGEKVVYGIPGAAARGFKVADDTRGEAFDPTNGDRRPSKGGIEQARRFLARRFPRLADAPLLEARVCQYENSPDGHFIVDRHPEAHNLWLLGGGSGHGFKLSPALGEFVAKRVLEDEPVDPFFSLARFTTSAKKGTQFETRKDR